jgi:ankyrin repeat protein
MIDKLFNLLKNHEYEQFIQIIKSNDNIDLNEPDELGNYLIHYAILYKQKDIVALLISKKCKLNILDNDGYSIFYTPIKMGYIDIVNILIYFSNIVIGIPLLEFQDKYLNIPLNYAIKFKKIDIIYEILSHKININYKDTDDNTVLHLVINIINDNNIDIIEKMLQNKISINNINKYGQTALHIAIENANINVCKLLLTKNIDINIGTIEFQLTPLLLSVILNKYEICKLILEYKPNINYQDANGYSVLHYAIQNKSKEFINLFINVDSNLINIDGDIALQLFFKNNYDMNNLDDYFFKEILIKSKLNIQNNTGKTVLHYLVENDIWEKYIDILINKSNKIYIQDINNITPFDIIKTKFPNKIDKFLDMIANSFFNTYITKSDKYLINIECIQNYTNKLEDRSSCIKIIKEHIQNNTLIYQYKKKVYCTDDYNISNTEFTTYIGISLDIIFGLIYLLKKFKNVQTSLTDDFLDNSNLEDYYTNNGIKKGLFGDFLNFEIIWSFQKLYYPTNLKKSLVNFIQNETKRYFIIPIGIELSNGAHANIILYDKQSNTIERFEPYGKDWPSGFNYNPKSLDHNLKNLFNNLLNTNNKNPIIFKYYDPASYEQKIGLQTLDINEYNRGKSIGDPGGFCAAWSLWYVEMRIFNKNININELIPKLIDHIRSKRIYFRTVIRSYTKNITDLRDNLLNKVNLDINKWFNDNYTKEEWDKFIELLTREIKILSNN